MIIAVDGPAASGKGTVARALAQHYNLPHLDTGLLYRAVGVTVLRDGGDPSDEQVALAACSFGDDLLNESELRGEVAGEIASLVSVHPLVRHALLERQRAFAARPGGAVLDGRDIGTVIAPHADVKLFVTARPAVRAERRFREMVKDEPRLTVAEVLTDILRRDERDSARATAPLVQADDADLLDTSDMDITAAVQRAIAFVEAGLKAKRR